MFIANLFAKSRECDWPICSSTEYWKINTFEMELYSDIKKIEIMKFAGRWMDVESTSK